jgi:electron transfer flavoprotein beta subunit
VSSILVPVKAVPLGAPVVRLAHDGTPVDAREWQLDPINALTVEWAVRLGMEVRAVSIGRAAADVALRDALARGCHDALRIEPHAHADLVSTAALLAAAARRFDSRALAFGYESYDASSGALPAATAAALDWPLVSRVRNARLDDGEIVAVRSREAGLERVAVGLPAVLSFVEGEIVPRHPRLAAAIAVRRTPIPAVAAGSRVSTWTGGGRALEPTPVRQRQARRLDAEAGVRELAALVAAPVEAG